MPNVLWMAAVRILPLATIASIGIVDFVRIPMLKPREPGDKTPAALYSHVSHNRYPCYACHPSLFPQRKKGFTHDDMDAGRYCGACHNGNVAFAIDDANVACKTCHVGRR